MRKTSGAPQLALDIIGHDARRVTTDLEIRSAQNRAVDRVVGEQHDGLAARVFEAQQTDAPIRRSAGIHAQPRLALDVARAAIDIRQREAPADRQPRFFELFQDLCNAVEQPLLGHLGVFGFDLVLVTVSEEGGRQPRRPNFRRGVGVRHRPPEVEPRNPCAPPELRGDFVVLGRRDETESRRDEHEAILAVVERQDAVVDAVMHAGRLARAVA